ncbi:MAG: InlB B-repeat-containing protein, partial [Spirochaetota bacterium]
VGPAGGLVFHDYGSVHADGWRYLEAAAPSTESTAAWMDPASGIGITAQGYAIGTGRDNTRAIADWLNANAQSARAAQICDELTLTDNSITHDDWFLPSRMELREMYLNLHNQVVPHGGFTASTYWSSTENGVDIAGEVYFADGSFENDRSKTFASSLVRPVRAFSTVPLYTVSYQANGGTSGTIPVDPAFYVNGQTVTILGNTGDLLGPLLQDGIHQRFLGWSTNSAALTADYTAGSGFGISADTTLYAIYTSDSSAVGKIGPAGGWIARDKTAGYTNGWRYLEVAPASTEWTSIYWSQVYELVGDTGMNRDWGKQNTERIVQWLDANTNDTNGDVTNKTSRAAYLPHLLTSGGFSDWYLPSYYEMADVLASLRAGDNLGGFSAEPYWTSSESDATTARRDDGSSYLKGNAYRIRAVRTFRDAAAETYAVVYYDNGATGGSVPIDLVQYHADQSVATDANSGALSRTNYVFTGWNTAADGTGTDYTAGSSLTMPASNLVLYAKWDRRPGSLDMDWSLSSAPNSGPTRIVIDYDGKIYLGGSFTSPWNRIARYLSNGDIDYSMNLIDGASHGFNGQPTSISPRSDGKVSITGDITSYKGLPVNRFFRLNNDGSIDSTLPQIYSFDSQVNAMHEQADGKMLLAGYFSQYTYDHDVDPLTDPIVYSAPRLFRLNADATPDAEFNPAGTGANSWITAMTVQPDGKSIIAGLFTSYNDTARGKIARVNVDGSLDTSFDPGTGANYQPTWIHVLGNGQILIAGGDFSTYNGTSTGRIARINADGTLDTTFNSGGIGADSLIYCGAVQSDGKILIGGMFANYNGTAATRLARLDSDGTLDTSFDVGLGPDQAVSAIAIEPDGMIIIGGGFTSYDGTARTYVARLHP